MGSPDHWPPRCLLAPDSPSAGPPRLGSFGETAPTAAGVRRLGSDHPGPHLLRSAPRALGSFGARGGPLWSRRRDSSHANFSAQTAQGPIGFVSRRSAPGAGLTILFLSFDHIPFGFVWRRRDRFPDQARNWRRLAELDGSLFPRSSVGMPSWPLRGPPRIGRRGASKTASPRGAWERVKCPPRQRLRRRSVGMGETSPKLPRVPLGSFGAATLGLRCPPPAHCSRPAWLRSAPRALGSFGERVAPLWSRRRDPGRPDLSAQISQGPIGFVWRDGRWVRSVSGARVRGAG
jgi:hypothetical protein